MHQGKYKEALGYYKKAYEQTVPDGNDFDIEDLTNMIEILEAIDLCYIYVSAPSSEKKYIKDELAKYRKEKDRLRGIEAKADAEAEHETEKADLEKKKAEAEKFAAETKRAAAERVNFWLELSAILGTIGTSIIGYFWRTSVNRKKIIEKQKKELEQTINELKEQKELVEKNHLELQKINIQLQQAMGDLDVKNVELGQTNEELRATMDELEQQKQFIEKQSEALKMTNTKLLEHQATLNEKNETLDLTNNDLANQKEKLEYALQLLAKQKQDLAESNKMVSESIDYASKLIVPSFSRNVEACGQFFEKHLQKKPMLIFYPRDTVSGDFFWAAELIPEGDFLIMAEVDCTGHGVPGAFMSIFMERLFPEVRGELIQDCQSSEDLRRKLDSEKDFFAEAIENMRKKVENQMTSQKNSVEPYFEIELTEKMKADYKSLKDKHNDGADASIVILDQKTKKLYFVGAKNPLFVQREGRVEKIEGNRLRGLAVLDNENIDAIPLFKTNTIELKKGERVFLLSDGYIDQFGGERGRRFGAKAFTQLIESTREEETLGDVKKVLVSRYENWKGTHPQIDDVLVVGFEV
jgi:hypothetical protein